MTKRLFDLDSCIFEFNAGVISCEKQGDFFVTVLDKTAFFPEGGGQTGDTGYIGGTEISDTQEKDGIIYHYSKQPVEVSENAYCKVDFRSRFCKMQNHTGEHIISGLVHSIFGYDNVGFHLGRNDMTMDYNGELSENDIDELETLANRAVYDNIPVFAEYPDKNELKSISYRSKLDLKEKVRIVTIPGIDCCACCAPHVKSTGSVGIIKITDFMRYKGGTRLHARCGFDGLAVFKSYQKSAEEISSLLSAKRTDISAAVRRLLNDGEEKNREIYELKRRLIEARVDSLEQTDESICEFIDGADIKLLRDFANKAVLKCKKYCAVFSGSDLEGYKYVIESVNENLREKSAEINEGINGRGGGSEKMITGSCKASKKVITDFFMS